MKGNPETPPSDTPGGWVIWTFFLTGLVVGTFLPLWWLPPGTASLLLKGAFVVSHVVTILVGTVAGLLVGAEMADRYNDWRGNL